VTFQRVLALDPASVTALVNLGRLHTMQGEIPKGREYLVRGVGLYPGYAPLFVALGENYYRAGEWTEATAAFERARALDPRNPKLDRILDELRRRAGPMKPF
jgi:tetratricopeptide (TPR) repeat protein